MWSEDCSLTPRSRGNLGRAGNTVEVRTPASVPSTRGRGDGTTPKRRHRSMVCGRAVADMEAVGASDETILEVQSHLQALLATDEDGARQLSEVRALAVLALNIADLSHLRGADPQVLERWSVHQKERDREPAEAGVNVYRSYGTVVPTDPLLAVGALRIAVGLLASDRPDELITAFVQSAAAGAGTPARWKQLRKFWKAPARFDSTIRLARPVALALGGVIDGRGRRADRTNLDVSVTWRNVPQLLPGAFVDEAVQLLPDAVGERFRRLFCSIALARVLSPELANWEEAAAALGIPRRVVSQCYQFSSWLGRHDAAAFGHQLRRAAERLDEHSIRIDYAARRKAFARGSKLDQRTWDRIRKAAGLGVSTNGLDYRPVNAAAWIWAIVTAGDWHYAPALALSGLPSDQARLARHRYVVYFCAGQLSVLQPHLEQLARSMLAERGLQGPLSLNGD